MKCKLAELTADADLNESRKTEKKIKRELKVKKSIKDKLIEVIRSERYL